MLRCSDSRASEEGGLVFAMALGEIFFSKLVMFESAGGSLALFCNESLVA